MCSVSYSAASWVIFKTVFSCLYKHVLIHALGGLSTQPRSAIESAEKDSQLRLVKKLHVGGSSTSKFFLWSKPQELNKDTY